MLVLSRKIGQSILIGDNIKIKITGYRDGNGAIQHPIGLSVSIGIDAPRSIEIAREELIKPYDKKPLINQIEKK